MGNEMQGELLYEYVAHFTQVQEYGASMEALLSGQAAPPPEGARFDIAFEGPITGPKLTGSIKAVDYLHVRADGRFQLHIHGEITADDGGKIAVATDGVGMGAPPVMQLRENTTLTTSVPEHSWVNSIQIWANGTVDVTKGEIRIAAYAA